MHRILIFGDSIVAGKGVFKEKSWVSRLAKKLDDTNKYNIAYNLGVPGESTSELIERLELECKTRIEKQPKDDRFVIIFAIGINDSKSVGTIGSFKTPLITFSENINNLIQIAYKYSSHLIFIGLTPVDENKTTQIGSACFLNKNIKKYNEVIKNICAERKIVFAEVFEDWTRTDYKNFLSDDGIHPNELGHEKIFKKVALTLDLTECTPFDAFQILKKEYSLSDEDIQAIKSKFIENKIFKSDLFVGQFIDKKPELIFGGPCIRKDVDGVCLNTFYQVFMPIKISSVLKVPCKIVLAVKEEITLKPVLSQQYIDLGLKLETGIIQLAKEFDAEVQIINTLEPSNDKFLTECVRELNINLSEMDSRYLYNLSLARPNKPAHFKKRIMTNKRVIAGHSLCFLKKISDLNKFLIVEDIEQYNCALYAKRFELGDEPNFLAFLPLPNIAGTAPMFKSERDERLLLEQDKNYYNSIWIKSPTWVLQIFQEIFTLVDRKKHVSKKDFEWFFRIIKKISKYFDINHCSV
ncbi:MAG: GDSL-type esterase/lipase family protein [bacterium]